LNFARGLLSFNRHNKKLSQTEPLLSAAKRLELEQKRERTVAHEKLFKTIKELHLGGMPILAIARRLKMSRNTVKKFLAVESVPPRQPHRQRYSPIQRFLPYLQKRWIEDGGIGELIGFANGVGQDRRPVEKAFESEWSQGQVEGQVNRLKLIKRQMYGRANFDLLRTRIVYGA
jgi:transposase